MKSDRLPGRPRRIPATINARFKRCPLYAVLFASAWLVSISGCARTTCLGRCFVSPFTAREDLELARREFNRAKAAPPVIGARILKALPGLFPDLNARVDAPTCSKELLSYLKRTLAPGRFTYNNASLQRLLALGAIHNTTDVMSEQATLLLDLATMDDATLGPYTSLPGEKGPPPTGTYFRDRVLAILARSNLYLNDNRVRSFLNEQVSAARDPNIEWLLMIPAYHMLNDRADGAQALIEKWLREIPEMLAEPADAVLLEVLVTKVALLGAYAERYIDPERMRPVLSHILSEKGRFPIANGIAGGSRDLAVHALLALDDPRPSFALRSSRVPFSSRRIPDLWDAVLDDPTEVVLPAYQITERLNTLEAELRVAKSPEVRCWLITEQAAWSEETEHPSLFDKWIADEETAACVLEEAFELAGVPETRRAAAAASMLKSPVRADPAFLVIARHPDWPDKSVVLRDAMIAYTLSETANRLWHRNNDLLSLNKAALRFNAQPAMERAAQLLADSPSSADRTRAHDVIAHWVTLAEAAQGKGFNDVYTHELSLALVLSIARLSPCTDLETRAAALIESAAQYRALAKWLFDDARDRCC